MTYNPALEYRQEAVRGASPIGLVVLLYDAALNSLHKAIRAMDAGKIEQRCDALNHVVAVLAQLQRSLDFDQGGEVAKNLDRFYDACRAVIMEATINQSREELSKLAVQLQGLRDSWKEADRKSNPAMPPAAAPVVSASFHTSYTSGENWSA